MAASAGMLPPDVRLMNGVATALLVLAAVALAAVACAALARLPVFSLRAIVLDGEMARSSVAVIRANSAPHLAGNFFDLDLDAARAAFESVPWVRRAVVRRVWPNRLGVTLEEHDVAAMWNGDDGSERLVNRQGEVFEANVGDVEDERLPVLSGPQGSAARVLAMHRRLAPLFAQIDAEIESLSLSRRGSWRAELDTGAVVELGRGGDDEVAQRAGRFARTYAQVDARFERPLEYADLRHADGYAVRLKGITTSAPHGGAPRRQ
jgi:cell division protein FtsQ